MSLCHKLAGSLIPSPPLLVQANSLLRPDDAITTAKASEHRADHRVKERLSREGKPLRRHAMKKVFKGLLIILGIPFGLFVLLVIIVASTTDKTTQEPPHRVPAEQVIAENAASANRQAELDTAIFHALYNTCRDKTKARVRFPSSFDQPFFDEADSHKFYDRSGGVDVPVHFTSQNAFGAKIAGLGYCKSTKHGLTEPFIATEDGERF